MIRTVLIALVAFAILAAAAVGHGFRTDRWGAPANHREAADRLQALPAQLGDWTGVDTPLDPRQVEVSQATGVLVRRYKHRYSDAEVSVMILCGRPGPISVHPPEACYGGAGYTPGPATVSNLPGGGSLWVADFKKEGPNAEALRIHWGWSDGGEWVASESPRTAFFQAKLLYKLYVIQPFVPSGEKQPTTNTSFMDALLPELKKCLVATP